MVEKEPDRDAKKIYNDLLQKTNQGKSLLYNDNLMGRIVWNEAQFMESLLNMYEACKDERYLEIFCEHAEHILKIRDDHANRSDYNGRNRPGWQTGSYYTLGVPLMIPDKFGNPALEIQGVHKNGNENTRVQIFIENNKNFSIQVRNDFRKKQPIIVNFKNLTLETAESIINSNLSPDNWIKARVIGNTTPIEGIFSLNSTYKMVMHELHTPIIGIPFLKFAYLVNNTQSLNQYQIQAMRYINSFEESSFDYEQSWHNDSDRGFYVFEPGGKYWASSLPIPYNALSANGLYYLMLYKVTGKEQYLKRTTVLAQEIREGITFYDNGTMNMPYWKIYSPPYNGLEMGNDVPINGLYYKIAPDKASEDISHFSLTLRFMIEAWKMGIVFQENDLKAVAKTFSEKIWKPTHIPTENLCDSDPSKGFFLSHNLEGKGNAYDYAINNYLFLKRWDSKIVNRFWEVYENRYLKSVCFDIDYLYGEVMLGWSQLYLNQESDLTSPIC